VGLGKRIELRDLAYGTRQKTVFARWYGNVMSQRLRCGSVTPEICGVSAILGAMSFESEYGEDQGKGNEGAPGCGPKNAGIGSFGPIT